MNESLHILLLEDSRTDSRLVRSCLKASQLRCSFTWAETLADAIAELENEFDVALLDLNLPDSAGMDTVRQVRALQPKLPIVVLSGHSDGEIALEALREGAQDYISKIDFNPSSLERSIRFAIERHERRTLEHELRVHREDSDAARIVQQRLMPSEFPALPGFEMAGRCQPADAVGGDFFNFIPWPGNGLAVVVGDVSGHGMPAALLMASTHRIIRTLKDYVPAPSDLLAAANVQICEDTRFERFVELFVAVIDLDSRHVSYVGAGHGGVLVKANGDVVNLPGTALPAGMTQDLAMDPPGEFQLDPGDLLAVYTDGLYEVQNPKRELLGQKAIQSLLRENRRAPLHDLIELLIAASCRFCGPKEPNDDITIALVRCTA